MAKESSSTLPEGKTRAQLTLDAEVWQATRAAATLLGFEDVGDFVTTALYREFQNQMMPTGAFSIFEEDAALSEPAQIQHKSPLPTGDA